MEKLGVYSYHQRGKMVGEIIMQHGALTGSTEAIQQIVDSRLRRFNGDPDKTWESLSNWSNGYLWVEPADPE